MLESFQKGFPQILRKPLQPFSHDHVGHADGIQGGTDFFKQPFEH